DVGKTVLDENREILTEIRFKGLGAHQGGCYLRLSKRRALTLPMLVASAVVTVDPEKKCFADTSIALGPVAPTPAPDVNKAPAPAKPSTTDANTPKE
ncbi:MAG: hypothetical protein MUF69_13480, partial [Desulfobacterota bacterium]|nr:hypothetical protein [Thermodesulfobacteriota bacterium]